MILFSTYSRQTSFGIFVVAFFIAILFFTFLPNKDQHLSSLFEGPVTVCETSPNTSYPRAYQDSEMNTGTGSEQSGDSVSDPSEPSAQSTEKEMASVDDEGRREVEAMLKQHENKTKAHSNPVYKDRVIRQLQIFSPQDGAEYPPNLCAPYLEWEDPQNNLWQIMIEIKDNQKTCTAITAEKRWRIPEPLWSELLRKSVSSNARLTIKGIRRDDSGNRIGGIQESQAVQFHISSDPADNYIVYRMVEPPFNINKTPNIFIRDIRKSKADIFLDARQEYCMNCHLFSSKQGNTGKLAFQVRSLVKGKKNYNLPTYLAVYDIDKHKGFRARLPFEIQMTTFMAWSPDGNKLAYSANQKVLALKPLIFETQYAAMTASDIAIYNLETNDTYLVPGASDPNALEVYPQWSPDGNRLIFSRSPVGTHPSQTLYDLYAVDLNQPNPAAHPIEGASKDNQSHVFPRFSPDGKWLAFSQNGGGDLIRATSDLYLMPGSLDGPSHRLECNVDYAADSWYSWSSNSRWIVFASKREGGVYASLYLTHIGDDGHSSPAIPLPIEEKPFISFNIPEFIKNRPDIHEKELFDALRVEQEPVTVQLRKTN